MWQMSVATGWKAEPEETECLRSVAQGTEIIGGQGVPELRLDPQFSHHTQQWLQFLAAEGGMASGDQCLTAGVMSATHYGIAWRTPLGW